MSRAMIRAFPLLVAVVLPLIHPPRSVAGGFCQVQIESILACDTGNEFDTRLRALKRRLDSIFRYNSYTLMRRENRRIGWGSPARFVIPGSRLLVVKPRRYQSGHMAMKVMLSQGRRPLVGTEVQMKDRGVFLLGGPRHREGVLIISIGAQTE